MIPSLKAGGDIKLGAIDLKNLTTDVYSLDALEIVKQNLFRIIRQQETTLSVNGTAVIRMSLFQAGQVYGMSSMLGYSLRNFDDRFQLERLAAGWGKGRSKLPGKIPFAKTLQDYIATFGPAEARRMTSLASMEARMAMELQVSALFGPLNVLQEKLKTAVGEVTSLEDANRKLKQAINDDKVESIRITVDDLTRLVLEAVAYGALLRDAECEAGSIYELTPMPRPEDDDGEPAKLKLPTPKGPKSPDLLKLKKPASTKSKTIPANQPRVPAR